MSHSRFYKELQSAPHLLIGGTTGSGKSTVINGFIHTFYKTCDVFDRLILIDPKRVELNMFAALPQCDGYGCTPAEALELLKYASRIMEDRYTEMAKDNEKFYTGSKIWIIIDELADLMISPLAKEIKLEMQHILQLGRAANIHIMAGTQAPSRKIIPAELVLNFTHRLALRCLSSIESNQIINRAGAEQIKEMGIAWFLEPQGYSLRQLLYFSEEEIKKDLKNYLSIV